MLGNARNRFMEVKLCFKVLILIKKVPGGVPSCNFGWSLGSLDFGLWSTKFQVEWSLGSQVAYRNSIQLL